LIKIYGVGGHFARILKLKEGLGFVSMEQMNDVWGLSPEVIVNNTHFKVFAYPNIERLI
jgi:hypothetical protein